MEYHRIMHSFFEKMGGRLRVITDAVPPRPPRILRDGRFVELPLPALAGFSVTVVRGVFQINQPESVELQILDCQPKDRHLLLMAREGRTKQKFLCGHDERDWFVASVPGTTTSVGDAKDRLRPAAATEALARYGVPARKRHRRHNPAFIRQGEWFFVPAPELEVDERYVLRLEPLRRPGGGKAHVVQELYRRGGEAVMVHLRLAPDGLDMEAYRALPDAKRRESGWRPMRRNPEAYARGSIRHPDHATVRLQGWHRIHLNAEERTASLGFLD
jgi:hypothetical protein